MTLPRGAGRALYAGNGQAVEFPFFFKVWEEEQLSVLITSPAGVTTPAAGWTATLDEDGGTVRYLHEGAPLPEGWKLAIVRDMPFVQEVDLVTGTRFDPEVIETALDMAAAERQQLLERLARAVVVEPTDESGPEALVGEIRAARDTAVTSATGAVGSARAAQTARGEAEVSAATAAAQREAACLCARRAEAAAEAAEESADLAMNREIQPPAATRRGGIRVGNGLVLMPGPDGVADVLEPATGLAVSETEAADAIKAVTVPGLAPCAGARLCLTLAETNTAEAPRLAVNSGPDLPILWAGAPPAPGELAAGLPWLLVCDGKAWQVAAPRPDGESLTIGHDGALKVPAATQEARGLGRAATDAEALTGRTGENGPAFVTPEQLGRRGTHVIETWRSEDGKSAYRKWSDGWVEQYFRHAIGIGNVATFMVPFRNASEIFVSKTVFTDYTGPYSAGVLSYSNITTTSFTETTNVEVSAIFCGYAAE